MGKKILLADDSITIQKVIELTFSDEDFEVVTVGNGRLAIEKVQDVRPDVVLCDIIMPEKDGYEVCDFVKKSAGLSHIPVLLLTGAFEPFDQERASRVGCDGFLAKPFEPQALIAKVKDLLRQVESRQPAAAAPAPVAVAPPPPPPMAAPAEPEPSPSATVWAAPSPVVSPVWEAPQTRPAWTPLAPAAAPPPAPPAVESGVHFIPEDPFSDEASGFGPVSGDTMRVPTFPDEPLDSAPEVEPEPYTAAPDDLLPMTADEEQSLAPEPMAWEEPPILAAAGDSPAVAAAPAPEPAAAPAPSERDLFLEEVFDEAAAAVEAAHAAHARAAAAPAPEPEPEPPTSTAAGDRPTPEPVAAPAPVYEPHAVHMDASVTEFRSIARDAGLVPEPVSAAPEPAPELQPEPEPIPEPEPVIAAPPPPEPEPVAPAPAPEPEPMVAPAPIAEDLELEAEAEESFASVTPPVPEPVPPPPSEAAAVAIPVDMVSQIAQRVVAQISEKVIREIAWEVIPDMAEALIKREIERLTAELQRG